VRLASTIVSSALLLSLASLCAAAPPSATPLRGPGRPMRSAAPGTAFQGTWSSDRDTAGTIQIMSLRGASISIVARGRFEAVGYVDGATALALACIPGPPTPGAPPTQYGLLRLQQINETTLRVRSANDFTGTATGEETWTLRGARPERPVVPENVFVAPSDSLRTSPEYLYVNELPEAVTKVAPIYPEAARAAGIEGQVMVQAFVGKDGLVKDVRVVKSIPQLDDAAVTAVRQWRFKPALSEGAPAEVWVAVPVQFPPK
jgi:TonB family protein